MPEMSLKYDILYLMIVFVIYLTLLQNIKLQLSCSTRLTVWLTVVSQEAIETNQ